MRNVVLDVVRKIPQTYYIEKSYSTAYFNITKLLYKEVFKMMQSKYLYLKKNIEVHVFLLSCQNKSCCSYMSKNIMSVKENFMVCSTSTLVDMSYSAIQQNNLKS